MTPPDSPDDERMQAAWDKWLTGAWRNMKIGDPMGVAFAAGWAAAMAEDACCSECKAQADRTTRLRKEAAAARKDGKR